MNEEGILPYDVCWSEERIIAYAEKHALEICEALNDFTFTIKDMCDMIAGGDFEKRKKRCNKERLKRLSGAGRDYYYGDDDDDDLDDFLDGLEPPPK